MCPPGVFVSVASKASSDVASLLFAILTREAISVAAKGLTRMKCWQKVTVLGWEDFEGVRRTTWRGRMVSGARSLPAGWSDPDKIEIYDSQGYGGPARQSC
jgi:hypothetical protein